MYIYIEICVYTTFEIQTTTPIHTYKIPKHKSNARGLCEELFPGIDARGGTNKSAFLRKFRISVQMSAEIQSNLA